MHGNRCQREFWCNFEVCVLKWPVVLHIELKWLLFYCKTVVCGGTQGNVSLKAGFYTALKYVKPFFRALTSTLHITTGV